MAIMADNTQKPRSLGRVSVVIPVWNRLDELDACLSALRQSNHIPHEVIVVDNGSEPAAPPSVGVTIIRNARNLGFAHAANQGIQKSMGEIVLLLNQDVQLSPDYLSRCCDVLRQHPSVGAVSGMLRNPQTGAIDSLGICLNLFWLEPIDRTKDVHSGTVWGVSGAAVVLRVEALHSVAQDGRYFEESYISYYEDVDLCWNLHRFGWQCWTEPEALAWHSRKEGGAHPPQIQTQAFANRYRLVLLNLNLMLLLVALPWWVLLEGARLLRWSTAKPYLWKAPILILKDLHQIFRQRQLRRAKSIHQ